MAGGKRSNHFPVLDVIADGEHTVLERMEPGHRDGPYRIKLGDPLEVYYTGINSRQALEWLMFNGRKLRREAQIMINEAEAWALKRQGRKG